MASNTDTLRAAHEAFNARSHDASVKGLLAEGGVVTDHGRGVTVRSHDEFAEWQRSFVATSSDIRIVDAQYIDGGDYVTAMFRAVGTQDGPLGGLPATGKPYSLDVCEVWHFTPDGVADEGHNYSDGLGMLIQLGHMPPPEDMS